MRTLVSRWPLLVWAAVPILLAGCTASSPRAATTSAPPPPAGNAAPAPASATPANSAPPVTANPDIVEDTPTYSVRRYRKSDMVRIDQDRIRYPFSPIPMHLYREDADYYYVRDEKVSREEMQAAAEAQRKKHEDEAAKQRADLEAQAKNNPLLVTPEQFESLVPPQSSHGVDFRVAGEGLPKRGQWRQNIAVADIDGDGHLDVVASPARMSAYPLFHVFLGDGKGNFKEMPVKVTGAKGQKRDVNLEYGGVAVADFDGDGRPDVAVVSHGGTVHVFLNRGGGRFQLADTGLPPKLTSQAVAAIDVNGDGRPDLVVSQDMVNNELRMKTGTDPFQLRIFLNRGKGRWEADREAIQGPCFSFNVFPIDLSGKGARDILTGCRALGGWGLTWKNDGKGKFSNELFEIIEQAAYHLAVAPGTFGPAHRTAFADLYDKKAASAEAAGINVYFKDDAGWHKVPVWREKNHRGRLTSIAMGDLDGDGLDDIVFPDRAAKRVRIFFQTPEGRFEECPESLEPPLDSPVADTKLADIDGDGRLDIVLSRTGFSEAPNDPGGFEVLLNQGPKPKP